MPNSKKMLRKLNRPDHKGKEVAPELVIASMDNLFVHGYKFSDDINKKGQPEMLVKADPDFKTKDKKPNGKPG